MDYKEIKKLMDDMGNSKLDSLEIEFPDGVKIINLNIFSGRYLIIAQIKIKLSQIVLRKIKQVQVV